MKNFGFILLLFSLLIAGCSAKNDAPAPVERLQAVPMAADTSAAIPDSVYTGEWVYVAIYSSIFHQNGQKTVDLTATLSIHNIDMENPIHVRRVRYYNLKGELIKRYLEHEITLAPLETMNFVIEQNDKSGGTGANFVVEWYAMTPVSQPLIESVMISTSGNQGISFTSQGKVIKTFGRHDER